MIEKMDEMHRGKEVNYVTDNEFCIHFLLQCGIVQDTISCAKNVTFQLHFLSSEVC